MCAMRIGRPLRRRAWNGVAVAGAAVKRHHQAVLGEGQHLAIVAEKDVQTDADLKGKSEATRRVLCPTLWLGLLLEEAGLPLGDTLQRRRRRPDAPDSDA